MTRVRLGRWMAGCVLGIAVAGARGADVVDLKYSFAEKLQGHVEVTPEMAYTAERGFGYDLGSKVTAIFDGGAHYATGEKDRPFFFSAKVPPGAYHVTVTLGGDGAAESVTTVKSETRRLMLENVHVPAGQEKTFSFLAHVRVPTVPGAGGGTGANATVALKPRERDPILYIQWDLSNNDQKALLPYTELDWDEKLTLEFSGTHTAVEAVTISSVIEPKPVTVYLCGDSTVTDQMMEPWGAWGQQLPRFFKEPVLIANYAESGETAASFISERRWPKVMGEVQPGDYVFIQFGINDQRIPVDQFKATIVKMITDAKAKGAVPVVVTSQNLKRLSPEGKGIQTLGQHPEAMKQAAAEQSVACIDLNAMSMKLYEALGREKLDKAFSDGTHQNMYGSYELAKCVVQGVVDLKLPIAQFVAEDWKGFDPTRPDPLEKFDLPADPQQDPARAGGPGSPTGNGPMAGAVAGRGRGTTAPATTRGN